MKIKLQNVVGYRLQRVLLRKSAVPSIFPWSNSQNSGDSKKDVNVIKDEIDIVEEENYQDDWDTANIQERNLEECTNKIEKGCPNFNFVACEYDVNSDLTVALSVDIEESSVSSNVHEDVIYENNHNNSLNVCISSDCKNENQKSQEYNTYNVESTCNESTQSRVPARVMIEDLQTNPAAVLYFTGIEDYDKFMTVFRSLDPEVQFVNHEENKCFGGLSLKNQLFLTLWKLRKNCPDFELSFFFSIPEAAVRSILKAWIIFMVQQWSKKDSWPNNELICLNILKQISLKQE